MTKTRQIILTACDLIDAVVDINGSPLPLEFKILTYLIRNYEAIPMFLRFYIERVKHQKK